ncbi:MAG: hypothetical protein HOW73_17605 [Polyangiaceae bacterium]|nr:hypothetical protein [Polyangiaceae bacterium]
MDDDRPRSRRGLLRAAIFVLSAALFGAFLHAAWDRPYLLVPFAVIGVGFGVFRWWSHRRLVRMLRRGDVGEIIAHWSQSFDRIPHAETMAPLMTATAFAAYGRVDDARRALACAARGPAWDAALEHRLFLDVILSTFEGEGDHAAQQASKLNALPMPDRRDVQERVGTLRQAASALVRAFQHRAQPGDLTRLEAASENSPLVHWAMRYAAAIVAIDAGERDKARALIDGAPRWPTESAFRNFHDEITGLLGA